MKILRLFGVLLCVLAFAITAAAQQYNVGPPSGGDDTAVLQAALDNCMINYPTGCTIQLSAGTYKSKQLIAENFHGSLQGMGLEATAIEVLAPLVVTNSTDLVFNVPPSRTNKYPMLLIFMGGDITVSDMTFKVSAHDPATPWCYSIGCGQTWLEGLVGVIGTSANLLVERVGFEGGPGTLDGLNCNNGPFFLGIQSPFQPLAGTFQLASSRFSNNENGFEVFGVRNARILIGGSPVAANTITGLGGGVMADVDNSTVEYSYNQVAVSGVPFGGVAVLQGVLNTPQAASRFVVQHNTILAGDFEDGILIADFGPLGGTGKTADLLITENTIELAGSADNPAFAGVEFLFTVGAVISNNRISGENAFMGIAAEADSHCMLQGNSLQQLQPLFVPMALLGVNSGFPFNTSFCTVIGGLTKVNVFDEGTNDILVGVNNTQGNPPGPALKEAMQHKRDLLKSRLP